MKENHFLAFGFISHLPKKLQAFVEAVNMTRSGTTFFSPLVHAKEKAVPPFT